LLLRQVEEEFRLAVFLLHRIVAGDRDFPEALMRSDSIAKDAIVYRISDQEDARQRQDRRTRQALQQMPDSRAQYGSHGVQL